MGKVSGNLGCNGFGATAHIDAQAITVERIFATLRACADARARVENGFHAGLTSIDHWTISGATLRLTGVDGTVLTFHAG